MTWMSFLRANNWQTKRAITYTRVRNRTYKTHKKAEKHIAPRLFLYTYVTIWRAPASSLPNHASTTRDHCLRCEMRSP